MSISQQRALTYQTFRPYLQLFSEAFAVAGDTRSFELMGAPADERLFLYAATWLALRSRPYSDSASQKLETRLVSLVELALEAEKDVRDTLPCRGHGAIV